MKKLTVFLIIISILFVSCNKQSRSEGKLVITAVNFPSYDAARAVAGDSADIRMLLPCGAESHSFEPTPDDIKRIMASDLFIYTGGESEEWVNYILKDLDSKVKVFSLMDAAYEVLEEAETLSGHDHDHDHECTCGHEHNHDHEHNHECCGHDHNHDHEHNHECCGHDHDHDHEHSHECCGHDHKHEHSHECCGHDHDHEHNHECCGHEHDHEHEHEHELDEHVWTSPRNERSIITELCKVLVEIDSANKAIYEKNAESYIKEIDEIDKAFRAVVDNASTKTLVIADRYPIMYFAIEYDLEVFAAFPGCAHETEANANTVAALIDLVKERGIKVILHMELSNTMLAKVISDETGAKALEFNSAHNVTKRQFDAGLTWTQIMRSNVDVLKEALD